MGEFEKLSSEERTCLEAISLSEQASCAEATITEGGGGPCSRETIQQLRAAGLVEVATILWLPLEMKRSVVHLTSEGKRVLASRDRN